MVQLCHELERNCLCIMNTSLSDKYGSIGIDVDMQIRTMHVFRAVVRGIEDGVRHLDGRA